MRRLPGGDGSERVRGNPGPGAGTEGIDELVVVPAEVTPVILHFREQLLAGDAGGHIPIGAEDDLLHAVAEDLGVLGLHRGLAMDDAHRLGHEIIRIEKVELGAGEIRDEVAVAHLAGHEAGSVEVQDHGTEAVRGVDIELAPRTQAEDAVRIEAVVGLEGDSRLR
jgi:hypothetical protein